MFENITGSLAAGGQFDRDACLARLRLTCGPTADEAGLIQFTESQTRAIPFENIDPYTHRPVLLDPRAIQIKMLGQSRGGYCFELNLLLKMALESFGFAPRMALARVYGTGAPWGGRTHMLLLVPVGERTFLADCGFGGSAPFHALPFECGRMEIQKGHAWRIMADDEFGFRLEARRDGWQPLYAFDPDEALVEADLVLGNFYTSSHPDSRFRRQLVVTRTTERGRVRLVGNAFREEIDGQEALRTLATINDLEQVLTLSFGLPGSLLPLEQIARRLKLGEG